MDQTELILKLAEIGWRGDLFNIFSLRDWLYKNFQILIEKRNVIGSWRLWFGDKILCQYYNIRDEEDLIMKILPDITLLWKCESGILDGPSLDNYEEPKTEWT